MAFNQNDIYTSSGSVVLFNAWTPYVSKFDTSTFYNWEQDNVPLYDLEERTYQLWEQGGFSTSAGVPGIALTVSADTPQVVLEQNPNIFTDVSSAIAAVPKVVRFPVLIEVANFGDLGPLELHNFRIEERGSIEIINRNFSRTYNASSDVRTTEVPSTGQYLEVAKQVSSLDLSNTLTDTSCLHISSTVLSGAQDTRFTEVNSIFYPSHSNRATPLTVSLGNSNFRTGVTNRFLTNVLENTTEDGTIITSDLSSINTNTSQNLKRPQVGVSDSFGGNVYGNACSKISVKNCDGPIYIRNFLVDGQKVQPVGVEVTNSKVVIENCAAVRSQEAGFKFNNSEVTLSRSAFAYRNYKEATATTRESELGTGFHFVNSDILVSSMPIAVDATTVGDTGAQGRDATFVASRNTRGFVLENSKLRGGVTRTSPTNPATGGVVCSELNTSAGMLLENSFVDLKGLVDVYGNNAGIEANNSFFRYENLTVDGSQTEGLDSIKSTFIFDSSDITDNSDRRQLDFSGNASHLELVDSTFKFKVKDNVPSFYGNSFFRASFAGTPAIYADSKSNVDLISPFIDVSDVVGLGTVYGRGIKATNGSTATLTGAKQGATFIVGPPQYNMQRTMAGVCADNNSVVNFHGPTAVAQFGVDVLAQNNSVMNFEPRRISGSYTPDAESFNLSAQENHTTVELHSTRSCLVAQRNSTINMRDLGAFPANWSSTVSGTAMLEESSYSLGSSGSMSGGSMQFFANPQDSAVAESTIPSLTAPISPTLAGRTNTLLINDGGFGSPDYALRQQSSVGGVCVRAVEDSIVNVHNTHFPVPVNASPADGLFFDASGDECSKFSIWNIADSSRLNASYLSLSGMHPISCEQHGPSAIYSSVSPSGWAREAPSGTPDTGSLSILDAFGAGSSVWIVPSGVDVNSPFDRFYPVDSNTNSTTASSLSQAGINVSGTTENFFGVEGAYNNRGFFRLYWSPKASARFLQNDLVPSATEFSGVVGPAYQIFAQGYNCSAPLSAIVPEGYSNASSIAPDLLKLSRDSNGDGVNDELWTSGFYYCEEMLENNPTQCILDESAADAFANARNASVGLAGRPRKTTIYSDSTERIGESYPGDTIGGFKSASIFDLSRDN